MVDDRLHYGQSVQKSNVITNGLDAPSLVTTFPRINIDPDHWQAHMQPNGNLFGRAIRRIEALRLHAEPVGQRWCQGITRSARLIPA